MNEKTADLRGASRLCADLETALPTLGKAVFSQPADALSDTKVIIRPVALRGERRYQLERFRGSKAYHQNLTAEELLRAAADELDGRYRQVLIVSDALAAQYSLKTNGSYKRRMSTAVPRPGAGDAHNREKSYILAEGENIPALVDLGVFTADFHVVRAKYDKYKQINRFIELVDDEFSRTNRRDITILDFGCGKSYLTFILYYYFTVKRGMNARIIGYDLKEDVVERCNAVAEKYGYTGLSFVHADVTRDVLYDEHIDMIVTLHACDTATDYALWYALSRRAEYIFSVPCCQHEVNKTIRRGGELDIFMSHGIIKERMSALLTDAIRAAVLEDMGYGVDMIEFIDFEHSPKNIMIRAVRGKRRGTKRIAAARALADKYSFRQTLLELAEGEAEKDAHIAHI
mgnify:FL=1